MTSYMRSKSPPSIFMRQQFFTAQRTTNSRVASVPPPATDHESIQRVRSQSDAVRHNGRISISPQATRNLAVSETLSQSLLAAVVRGSSARRHQQVNRDLATLQLSREKNLQAWIDTTSSASRRSSLEPPLYDLAFPDLPRPSPVHVQSAAQLELQHPSPRRISSLIRTQQPRTSESRTRQHSRQVDISPTAQLPASVLRNTNLGIAKGSTNVQSTCDRNAELEAENRALRSTLAELQHQLKQSKSLIAAESRARQPACTDPNVSLHTINAKAELLHAQLNISAGLFEAAEQNVTTASEIAEACKDTDLFARCCYWHGIVALRSGMIVDAVRFLGKARALNVRGREGELLEDVLQAAEADMADVTRPPSNGAVDTQPSIAARRHRQTPTTLTFSGPQKPTHQKRYSLSSALPTAPARYAYRPAPNRTASAADSYLSVGTEPFTPQSRRHSHIITIDEEDQSAVTSTTVPDHDPDNSSPSSPSPGSFATPTSAAMVIPNLRHRRRRSKILDEEAQDNSDLEFATGGAEYATATKTNASVAPHAQVRRLCVTDEEMQSPKVVPRLWKRLSVVWTRPETT